MPRVDLPLDIQQGLDPLFLQALQSFGDSSEDEGDDLLDPTGLDLPPLDHISIPDSGSEGDSSHKSSGGLSPHASRDGGDDDFSRSLPSFSPGPSDSSGSSGLDPSPLDQDSPRPSPVRQPREGSWRVNSLRGRGLHRHSERCDEGDDLLDPTGLDLPPLDHISIPDSGSEGDSSHKSSGGLSPHASRDGGDDDFSRSLPSFSPGPSDSSVSNA
ncbi:hypothetical protein L202_07330 [Cryptococcus amylolentus CBS 6039]|uniref:Uncharacterized protein n=1 Tax=Cryptococcus amylolentus CBS 6039 TaxID=1295533 RepID=A0A1E3HBT7_9TREE|nr:hypothetical protein L202_07330 [Cryptococcus amylolentus CBS 6039]ODN73802.1 hypothetical protein L202_07330 [Cryptococcus amylolentus CBS 6039]